MRFGAFATPSKRTCLLTSKASCYGDVWTWTALCADTKLVPSRFIGGRDAFYARVFANDVASRLASRVQVTTDGYHAYLSAIEGAFGVAVDYAMLVKTYGQSEDGERRYSPAACTGAFKRRIVEDPKVKDVSTSYVERQNLTMRMSVVMHEMQRNGVFQILYFVAKAVRQSREAAHARPNSLEPSESIEVTGVERKLIVYLEDLVKMQGFGNSKSAVARGFIWKEVNRLIESRRLKKR